MKNINKILQEQIELIKPDKDTFSDVKKTSDKFCDDLGKKLKSKRVKAEVFIGGSLAKNTLVRKDKYDVDIFVRFDGKYESDEISKLLGRVLGRKAKKIHGSRDYYQLVVDGIIIEIIPVMKIKKPEQAQNITDLSYFHVNYIKSKIRRNKKLADEIMLAKTFAYAQNCYGAESYIHGFSGYALELLICHYRGFLGFLKSIIKTDINNIRKAKEGGIKSRENKAEIGRRLSSKSYTNKADYISDKNKINKIIIDDSKFYKNKQEILRELNESKINGPVILIDPTFKERNTLASLNQETFVKFREVCREFLRNPDNRFFEKRDLEKELKKKHKNLIIIEIKTNKQAGDIAGSKSKKFFGFFCGLLGRKFEIKISEFDYNEKKNAAYFYFVLEKKKDEIVKGPHVTKVENLTGFKKAHPKSFIKNHFAYAKVKHDLTFEKFLNMLKRKYKKVIEGMGVKGITLKK